MLKIKREVIVVLEKISEIKDKVETKIVRFVEGYKPKTRIDRKIKYEILKRMVLR